MRQILFKAKRIDNGEFIEGCYLIEKDSPIYKEDSFGESVVEDYVDLHSICVDGATADGKVWCDIDPETLSQFTGYEMFKAKVFFGDLVSNNYGTNKEVIREIVEHEGNKMMKRVKGNSRLPKYIPLHEWFALNYKVIGNIYNK